jgi:hypothetical protein
MATTPFEAAGALTGSLATLYTVPTNRYAIIKAMTVANDSGGALSLIVEVKATSGGTQRRLIPARTVNDKATDLCAEVINHVIEQGGIIQASGNGLVFQVSGVLVNV